jgi:hypothetical protein
LGARLYTGNGWTDNSKWGSGGRRLDTDSFQTAESTVSADTDWHIHISTFDWTNAVLTHYVDGSQVAQRDPFQSAGDTVNADCQSDSGISSAPLNEGFRGDIVAALIFKRVLTSGEIAGVTSYYATKYAITLP